VPRWVETGVVFSQEETELLLEGVPPGQIPASTLEEMQRAHLDLYAGILSRNLSALLPARVGKNRA
jgi:hypothetical protein